MEVCLKTFMLIVSAFIYSLVLITIKNGKNKKKYNHILVLLVMYCVIVPELSFANDEENCLLCHKMPGFGVFLKDKEQYVNKKLFYINEDLYKSSYHGRLMCTSCHDDIDKVPHSNSVKVDCAKECHIRDPSTNRKFNHTKIVNEFKFSVHGTDEDNKDKPDCKYCHSNKPYQIDLRDDKNFVLEICLQCHESKDWTERFFSHINYRAHKRRSSKQIVELCSECHANQEMMNGYNLDVIIGFNETFHGKAIRYGNTEVANCLNCHAPYKSGFSPHNILSKTDIMSPVSNKNKIYTCRQSGCHVDAIETFATSSKIHPSSLMPASMERRKNIKHTGDVVPDVKFQETVLMIIKYLYKVLIVVVVGGLLLHQILELITVRRSNNKRLRI